MLVVNFRCQECLTSFHVEKISALNATTSRCPECGRVVTVKIVEAIIDLGEKKEKVRTICEACSSVYYVEKEEKSRVCRSCFDKKRPFAKVVQKRVFSKQQLREIEHRKNIDKKYRQAKELCEILLQTGRNLGLDEEQLLETSEFVVKYVTMCNKAKEHKIRTFK